MRYNTKLQWLEDQEDIMIFNNYSKSWLDLDLKIVPNKRRLMRELIIIIEPPRSIVWNAICERSKPHR